MNNIVHIYINHKKVTNINDNKIVKPSSKICMLNEIKRERERDVEMLLCRYFPDVYTILKLYDLYTHFINSPINMCLQLPFYVRICVTYRIMINIFF